MEDMSTGMLFAMRRSIIAFTQLSVMPLEYLYDSVEDELERRGHRVRERKEDTE